MSGGIGAGRGVNDQHTDTLGSGTTNTGYDDQGTHATNDAYTSSLPMHTHRITPIPLDRKHPDPRRVPPAKGGANGPNTTQYTTPLTPQLPIVPKQANTLIRGIGHPRDQRRIHVITTHAYASHHPHTTGSQTPGSAESATRKRGCKRPQYYPIYHPFNTPITDSAQTGKHPDPRDRTPTRPTTHTRHHYPCIRVASPPYHWIANTRIRGECHPQKGVQTAPILPNIPPL